jgi:Domain of unknown function (DUF4105)
MPATSQTPTQTPATPEPGSQLTVYLLTMGPGDQVWEKFGHDAIWIHDEANHSDIAYHWGLFDFADKEFFPRFIQGRMRYSMGAFDMNETVDAYRQANRTVWAQQLNFSPAQRERLAEFIAWNNQPQNRFYHYDYFRDNCSTRVRDALDRGLGGIIQRATENVSSHSTYRFHTARLTQDDWPVFTGTMMGLGQPTDTDISAWEEMFLPVRMMDRLRTLRVPGVNGSEPLVLNERVLVQATRAPEDTQVRRGIFSYLEISLVILAFGLALWFVGKSGASLGLLTLATAWSVVAGLAGVLLAGLWAFTDHLYSYRNENVLQLNPLSLVVAVLLIRLMWKRRRFPDTTPGRFTIGSALVVAGLSALGFVLQVLPAFHQVNGDVIALALPLPLSVLVALLGLAARSRREAVAQK